MRRGAILFLIWIVCGVGLLVGNVTWHNPLPLIMGWTLIGVGLVAEIVIGLLWRRQRSRVTWATATRVVPEDYGVPSGRIGPPGRYGYSERM